MKSFIHRRGFKRGHGKPLKIMNTITDLIKSGLDALIRGHGKRQLLKLGAVTVPALGIAQNDWDATTATIVAAALILVEIIFSKLNAIRLNKAASPPLVD
tara:strand:- start:807 stop:1106 length:300 start_codon:yes stop_codon:yes gene_type:complete